MSKNGLHRYYGKLDAAERFRLDVLAMARGDERKSERLVRSCPRFTYTTNDRAFTARWSASENITLRMCAPLLRELGRLRVVDAFRVLAPYQEALNSNLAFDAYYKGHEAAATTPGITPASRATPRRGPKARTRQRYGSPTRTSGIPRWSATKGS